MSKIITILLVILAVFLAGCIETEQPQPIETEQPQPPVPEGISLVTTNYIANDAVTDKKLAANSTASNFTYIAGAGSITTTGWAPLEINTTVTTNRVTALQIMFTGQFGMSVNERGFIRPIVNNTLEKGSTAIPPPYALPITNHSTQADPWNNQTVSAIWYNASVPAGTYRIEMQGNVTGGTLAYQNRSLVAIAIPK